MTTLEELQRGTAQRGIFPDCSVTVVDVQWFGSEALELIYKDPAGKVANVLLYRHDEPRLELALVGRPWSFDGDPERIAHTVPYKLSDAEVRLYKEVTDYVREEWGRAEALGDDKRAGTVGFALTILQRHLASSPEAIYQSLRRRRERLESRLRELELLQRGGAALGAGKASVPLLDAEDLEDLEDAPEGEALAAEAEILDQATAAQTIDELEAEIATLQRLEALAQAVRRGGEDRKWKELAVLFSEIFTPAALAGSVAEGPGSYGDPKPTPSPHQKLVVFTEHRDTLNYLQARITTILGRQDAVVVIHGAMGREERKKAEEAFKHDPEVRVLVATDAAGEGIHLQRAHLMVNYDLPWNPNRLEQRFGRIQDLLEEKALAQDSMDASRVQRVREDMERAGVPTASRRGFRGAWRSSTSRSRSPRCRPWSSAASSSSRWASSPR